MLGILTEIRLKSLKKLVLCACKIYSVEMLPRIEMPLLEILYIHYNGEIFSVGPLRKARLNHFNYLSMRRTLIIQKEMQWPRGRVWG